MSARDLPSSRRRWPLILLAGLAVLALGWLLYTLRRQGFDWERFARTFQSVDPAWISLALGLSLATYLGRALRWKALMGQQKPGASLWGLLIATIIGFTAIVVFGRAGEMVRPYLIAKKEKVAVSSQFGVWLLERIYDTLTALTIFGYALSRVSAAEIRGGPALSWVLEAGGVFVGVVSTLCLVVLFLVGRYSEQMERRMHDALTFLPDGPRYRLQTALSAFVRGVTSTRSTRQVLKIMGYSVLEWLLIVSAAYCLVHAVVLPRGFTFTDVAVLVGFVAFGAIVQIPGIGGGFQVASVVVLRELFGLPLETASGLALLLWLVTFVSVVPFGIALAFHEGIQLRRLRHLGEEAA